MTKKYILRRQAGADGSADQYLFSLHDDNMTVTVTTATGYFTEWILSIDQARSQWKSLRNLGYVLV